MSVLNEYADNNYDTLAKEENSDFFLIAKGCVKFEKSAYEELKQINCFDKDIFKFNNLKNEHKDKVNLNVISFLKNEENGLLNLECEFDKNESKVNIIAKVNNEKVKGIQIDALSAIAIYGLSIYNKFKYLDSSISIGDIELVSNFN